jgi:photosystem II stability/assembly factor-like uncharacterized protein
MSIALLLLAALPAGAHIPHHTIDALAVPADLSPSETWYAVHTPYGVSNLMASTGGSQTGWEAVGGEPMSDVILDAARLDDGTLVLLSEQHLWWSPDGASWLSQEPPTGAEHLLADDGLWVGGVSGVWRGQPGSALEHSLDSAGVSQLQQGPGGLLAVAVGGASLWIFDGDAWSELPGPGAELISGVADGGGVTYAGDIDGQAWRHDGSWSACGALPEDTSGNESYPHVTHMAVDGARVLAVPAWKGPFVSEDACETWQDRASPLAVQFSQTSITQAFTTLLASGDTWAIAGWDSVGLTRDAGASWTQAFIMPPDLVRGLEHSPTFVSDGFAYVGANGAGIMRSNDGYHFESLAGGMDFPNIQQVVFPAWAQDDRQLFAISNHAFWRSDDGGWSWVEQDNPHGYVFAIETIDDPERIWVFGRSTSGAQSTQLSESLDDGRSWANIPALDLAMGQSTPNSVTTTGSGELCLATNNPAGVVCSSQGQTRWDQTYTGAADRVTTIYAWPPEAPSQVVFADELGVHVSDDDGQSWELSQAMLDDKAYTMVMADDGTLFLATTSAALLRSMDGGDSWEDLDVRFPAQIFVMDPRPDFDANPELLVGTHDGTYLLSDATGSSPSAARWGAYNLVDNSSTYIHWHDEPAMLPCGDCVMSQIQPFEPGTEAYLGLRGDTLRIIGTSDGASELRLEIDGQTAGIVGDVASDEPAVLFEAEGLGEGYHQVVLTGISGDGFALDVFESGEGELVLGGGPDDTGPGDSDTDEPDETDPPDDTETDTDDSGDGLPPKRTCFCGSAGVTGGALWLLAGLSVALRRRRGGPGAHGSS